MRATDPSGTAGFASAHRGRDDQAFDLDIFNLAVEYCRPMAAALDQAFAALSDPTRRAIVNRLARGPARVTDVADRFPISLNAVSKHLKVLERAGLLRRRRSGREHHLELRAAPLRAVALWASRYERFWNEKLDALDAFLEEEN
jgi:DNA-binding transcriptional ArsR family regulator